MSDATTIAGRRKKIKVSPLPISGGRRRDPKGFVLRKAVEKAEMEAYQPEFSIITLHNVPKYVKVSFSYLQRAAMLDHNFQISQGLGLTCALEYGLQNIVNSGEASDYRAGLECIEDSDLCMVARVEMSEIIDTFDFSIPDPLDKKGEKWSFRCPTTVSTELARQKSAHHMTRNATMLALPSILLGIAYQPGVDNESSEHMLNAVHSFLAKLAERAERLYKILETYK